MRRCGGRHIEIDPPRSDDDALFGGDGVTRRGETRRLISMSEMYSCTLFSLGYFESWVVIFIGSKLLFYFMS